MIIIIIVIIIIIIIIGFPAKFNSILVSNKYLVKLDFVHLIIQMQ